MKKLRDNQGITLISLAVTIVVMMILAISVTMSATSAIELKKYNAIKQDIIALSEDVKVYYLENGQLPIYFDRTISLNIPTNDKNPNDNGIYYAINVSNLPSGESLNHGEGNKKQDFNSKDLYVVNEESLTVYYLDGAVLDGKKHYTIVDTLEGGSFAEAHYSKVDLPIISVVTMESNGKDKSHACTGDTITLKILSNYNFTTLPTVQINNENVEVTWNGKVGTATYKLPYAENATEYDKKIPLKISGYTADERSGEEINEVNFGNMVYRYAETICEAFNRGTLQIGDYVKYTPSNTSAKYTSVTNENGYANQTYSVDTSTQWRVLGTEDDKIVLISADPIKKNMNTSSTNSWNKDPYFYMKGAYSHVNCTKALNDICGIYSSSIGTARSITIEDINNVLGVEAESNKVYFESDETKTNIDLSGDYAGWLGLGGTYTYKSTDYTPEGYVDGKKTVSQQNPKPTLVTQNSYVYSANGLMTKEIGKTTVGELLFNQTLSSDNCAKSYWIVSPAMHVYTTRAGFGCGRVTVGNVYASSDIFASRGDWSVFRYAVRPVVILNSNVTVDQVPKIMGSLTIWEYDNRRQNVEKGNASNGQAGANLGTPQ